MFAFEVSSLVLSIVFSYGLMLVFDAGKAFYLALVFTIGAFYFRYTIGLNGLTYAFFFSSISFCLSVAGCLKDLTSLSVFENGFTVAYARCF